MAEDELHERQGLHRFDRRTAVDQLSWITEAMHQPAVLDHHEAAPVPGLHPPAPGHTGEDSIARYLAHSFHSRQRKALYISLDPTVGRDSSAIPYNNCALS